jgi:flagellar basal-body rod protein FlgB
MSDLLFHSSFNAVHQVLDLRQRQHSMTAANLANADTPGYQARYLDFSDLLQEVAGSDDGHRMQRAHPLHMGQGGDASSPEIVEVEAPAWSTNGNSVFPEQEHARLRANSLVYDGLTRGVSRRFALLKFAAADGRR